MRLNRVVALFAGASLLVAGCTQRSGPLPAAGPLSDQAVNARAMDVYLIGPGDELRIDVWRNPDVSATVPVRPDGRISVALLGDVEAADLSPEELARRIETGLARYIRDARVTVTVTRLLSHEFLFRIRVTGAVENPLSTPHRPGMTVLDLVLEAGGLTDFAAPNRARLYRRTKGKNQSFPVRLEDILEKGKLETNYIVLPGDIITIPEQLF